ncbi:class I SAM-dependent methyltransferase [Uliginosibacterium sp. H1]|uniref:class I SAM-dependent methyltransferase n=1 Tax=Uliginosibacterium sp. H1 TaxID=3114757 RepID=UPI002E17CA97|nr:methyltransferase type 12 [Uliginosibacterium sp. H1]
MAGIALVFLLARSGVLPPVGALELACLQGLAAALVSIGLRCPRWWTAIHLGFMPLIVLAVGISIPAWLWLSGFAALALIYWSSFRTQVPLFLSNRITVHKLAAWLPPQGTVKLLDIGSGTGSLLTRLARLRPDWALTGIESAPAPYVLSRWLARKLPQLHLVRGDFWKHSLAGYDVVYAFLSPVPMGDLWRKAVREMRPGSWLVSNSFAIPGAAPEDRVEVGDTRGSVLYCYRIPGRGGRQANAAGLDGDASVAAPAEAFPPPAVNR